VECREGRSSKEPKENTQLGIASRSFHPAVKVKKKGIRIAKRGK